MECKICKITTDELKNRNSRIIDNIDRTILIINEKIADEIEVINNVSPITDGKDSDNCMGETGKYCKTCQYVEFADDVECYWCKKFRKIFILSENTATKQLRQELVLLNIKRNDTEQNGLQIMELESTFTDKEYKKIMLKHFPDFSEQNFESAIYICATCKQLIDKLIGDRVEWHEKIIGHICDDIDKIKRQLM